MLTRRRLSQTWWLGKSSRPMSCSHVSILGQRLKKQVMSRENPVLGKHVTIKLSISWISDQTQGTQFCVPESSMTTTWLIWLVIDQEGFIMRVTKTAIVSSTSMETSLLQPANTEPSPLRPMNRTRPPRLISHSFNLRKLKSDTLSSFSF